MPNCSITGSIYSQTLSHKKTWSAVSFWPLIFQYKSPLSPLLFLASFFPISYSVVCAWCTISKGTKRTVCCCWTRAKKEKKKEKKRHILFYSIPFRRSLLYRNHTQRRRGNFMLISFHIFSFLFSFCAGDNDDDAATTTEKKKKRKQWLGTREETVRQ